MLSDIGSWASIIGLMISFATGFGVCKFISKKNTQKNSNFSLFQRDINQKNENN